MNIDVTTCTEESIKDSIRSIVEENQRLVRTCDRLAKELEEANIKIAESQHALNDIAIGFNDKPDLINDILNSYKVISNTQLIVTSFCDWRYCSVFRFYKKYKYWQILKYNLVEFMTILMTTYHEKRMNVVSFESRRAEKAMYYDK